MLPTYAFVGALGVVIVVGVVKSIAAGGAPDAVERAAGDARRRSRRASAWMLLRAFASGCTAMTGVEAVCNARADLPQAGDRARAAHARPRSSRS